MIAVARVAELLHAFGAAAPPGSPRLVVVDHADNSGATATISGTPVGSTNTVYLQSFTGSLGTQAWDATAAIGSDGTVLLGLAPGHYFAYVASSLAGNLVNSSVTYFVVTDGLESLYSRCLAAVQARILALALPGLPSGNVLIRKVPIDRNLSGGGLPAIVLSPQRAAMPSTEGTNHQDDVRYDVLVTLLDRDNQEASLEENLDRQLLWREQIARAFRNQRLAGVPEVINAAVESAEGLLQPAWEHELMASALLLRFTSRETRGIH